MRTTVHRTRAGAALVAILFASLSLTTRAFADDRGWALDRYEPSPAGDVWFAADDPQYNRTRLLAVAVTGDYARNPLVFRPHTGQVQFLIQDMFVLHAAGTINLLDHFSFNFSLPISLLQSGTPGNPAIPTLGAYSSPVSGDMRFGLRIRIAGQAETSALSWHIGGYLFTGVIPYNDRRNNVTDADWRGRIYTTFAGHPGPIRYSLTLGGIIRPTTHDANLIVESELYASFAIGVAVGNLTIGPEIWLSASPYALFPGLFNDSQRHAHEISAEATLGAHYTIANFLQIGLGGGPGISQSVGTPEFRLLARIAYAPAYRPPPAAVIAPPPPPPDADRDGFPDTVDACPQEPAGDHPDAEHPGCPLRDSDHDGVFDRDDRCPQEPAGDHPDPQRPGCPLPDTDHDGVMDPDDRCVTTPAGDHPDPDRPGCPDGDDDNDGVLNHQDQCPTVHQGIHPDPARAGCPLPDRDNDSVPDAVDACPDQPGAPSPDPRRNGCPGLVRIEHGQLNISQQVFFATNRDRILPRSFPVLQSVADALRATPEIHRVSIEGHTDNVGVAATNLDLSQRRANSVLAWLTNHGIEAARLEAHGYGDARPIAPNTTARGRARNRRVEFHITDPAENGSSPALGSVPSEPAAASPGPAASAAPNASPAPASNSASPGASPPPASSASPSPPVATPNASASPAPTNNRPPVME